MPLPLPTLDNRRWADLVEEGRALIPRYATAWTDHNAHDPGITLMELLAWLAEMNVYRANQVPERHVRKFLQLIGFTLEPPNAAQAVLTFAGVGAVDLGSQFATAEGLTFRALRSIGATAASLTAIQVDDGGGTVHDHTADWRDRIPVECLGHDPKPGAALYLGFQQLSAAVSLSLYFWLAEPGGGVAHLVWEAFTGGPDPWTPITPAYDDTQSLIVNGTVELTPPAAIVATQVGNVSVNLFYLRCRMLEGAYDSTPLLANVAPDSVTAEQAVPEVETFRIPIGVAPAGQPPAAGDIIRFDMQLDSTGRVQSLTFLGPNAAGHPDVRVVSYQPPAANAPGALILEFVHVPSSLFLPDPPVQRESLRVYSHQGVAWQEWERREDFDSSHRTDFHYTIDAATGRISFGDGERGRTLPDGAAAFAFYRITSAELGNVLAGTIVRSTLPGIAVTNLAAAAGGAPPEDVTGAAARAVALLYSHDRRSGHPPTRGVNLEDYERLALTVPFTRVARAKAYANVDGDYPCLSAAGVVTVVIIPDMAVPKPEPSPSLIHAVWCYLDKRRTICTQVKVIGPHYLEVRVLATVKLLDPAGAGRTLDEIRRRLDAFLDPRTGGPDGAGWPFGRAVYRSEILSLIDGVPNVDHVVTLEFRTGNGAGLCGNVTLCPGWLVTPGPHRIEVTAR